MEDSFFLAKCIFSSILFIHFFLFCCTWVLRDYYNEYLSRKYNVKNPYDDLKWALRALFFYLWIPYWIIITITKFIIHKIADKKGAAYQLQKEYEQKQKEMELDNKT